MYVDGLVGQERDLGGCLKLMGRGYRSGNCRCYCRVEELVVESSGGTPHGSKSHERP